MKISVRFAVAGLCVAAVLVVSIIIITLSSVYSHRIAVKLGKDHAVALASIAALKTEYFFNEQAAHARQIQVLVKRQKFLLPKDDTANPMWYQKWHDLIEAPMIGANYSDALIFGILRDESVLRGKVLPRGPGLTGNVLSSYVYNPWHNPVAEEHQHYLANQSKVPASLKEHYPFANVNGSRFPFPALGAKLTNNTPDSAYWLRVGVIAFPPEVAIPHGVPLHNNSGYLLGHLIVVRTFVTVNNFLLSATANFAGLEGFLVDVDGLMVGTTLPEPAYTQTFSNNRSELTTDSKYCVVSPPTDPVVALSCRIHVENYSFPPLYQEYLRHPSGHAHARNILFDRSYDGTDYFVVVSALESTRPINFGLMLFLFYPKDNVLSEVTEARGITIGLGVVVAVVSAFIAVLGIHFLLRPLSQLAADMKLMGSLRSSKKEFVESVFSEVYTLQATFTDTHAKLQDLKKFVPHGLLTRPSDEMSDVGSMIDTDFSHTERLPEASTADESPSEGFDSSLSAGSDEVKDYGLNKRKLRRETNVLYSKRCSVLSLDVSNLPDDAESLRVACDKVLSAFVENVIHCGGVIEKLSPNRSLATFNAHMPCMSHEKRCFHCAEKISNILRETPYTSSITVDSSQHFVGNVGHLSIHSALSVFGEAYDMTEKLHDLSHTFVASPILLTERVVAELGSRNFVPIDIVAPRWIQDTRKQKVVVYKPSAALCTIGMRNLFSQLLTGDYDNAQQSILKQKKEMPEHDEALTRVAIACDTCANRHYTGFARPEVPHFESLGNKILKGPETVQLHQRTAVESGVVVEAIKEAVGRNQPSHFEEEGLIGMFVQPGGPSSPTSDGDGDDVTRSVVDHQGREWRRCDDMLGKGGFSVVYKGIGERGQFCAMKYVKITVDTEIEDLANELDMLSRLSHENLVSYYSCCPTKNELVLVMEYVTSGTLGTLARTFGGIPVELLKRNARDILTGLAFLHSHGIVHCDLKPENVLLNVDGSCKLCDFGSAIARQMSCSSYLHVRGTAAYMAPEVAQGHSPTERSDVWSFGITMLEMVTNKPAWPFLSGGTTGEAKMIERVGKMEDMVPEIPLTLKETHAELYDLIDRCLQRDPNKRANVQQLLASPFFI